jgi:hypothetical protein
VCAVAKTFQVRHVTTLEVELNKGEGAAATDDDEEEEEMEDVEEEVDEEEDSGIDIFFLILPRMQCAGLPASFRLPSSAGRRC